MSPRWRFVCPRSSSDYQENERGHSSQKCVNLVHMTDSTQDKLSVSLALQALSEAADEVRRLEALLAQARGVRNDILMDAARHVSITRLARITGLSREQASKIASTHLRGV